MPKPYRKLHKHKLCNITVIIIQCGTIVVLVLTMVKMNLYITVCITNLIIATERFQFYIEVIHRILLITVHMYFHCTEQPVYCIWYGLYFYTVCILIMSAYSI